MKKYKIIRTYKKIKQNSIVIIHGVEPSIGIVEKIDGENNKIYILLLDRIGEIVLDKTSNIELLEINNIKSFGEYYKKYIKCDVNKLINTASSFAWGKNE